MLVPVNLVKPSYICFKIASVLCVIPASISLRTLKMKARSWTVLAAIHYFLFGLTVVKALYMAFSSLKLVGKLFTDTDSDLAPLLFGLTALNVFVTQLFWSWELFHNKLSEAIICFNCLRFGPPPEAGNLRQALRSLDLHSLLLVLNPFIMTAFVPLYAITAILFPHWSIFISSAMPSTYLECWWLYTAALYFEIITAFFANQTMLFVFYFEMALVSTFFSHILTILDRLRIALDQHENNSHGSEMIEIMESFDAFRVLIIIIVRLFHIVLFTGKLQAFVVSILGTFYVIRYNSSGSPLLLLFFATLSLNALAVYLISCKNLFELPSLMKEVKLLFAILLRKHSTFKKGKTTTKIIEIYVQRKIKSVKVLGISDGYREMDSFATLVFIDFYLGQVISLLLL